jgi:hypothetical protein
LITKFLVSGACVLGSAVALATPVGADPSVFNTLSCGCQTPPALMTGLVQEQISQGVQDGLTG